MASYYTQPKVAPLPGDPTGVSGYKPPNAMAPPNPWAAQPQPRATAGQSNVFAPPPGFNVGEGSQNQALNQQVYGSNYFPGNLPNYQGINTIEQFNAQTPEQQAGYRNALYQQNRLNSFLGPQPGQGDRFSYNQVQDFSQNPGYQSQLHESERALQRHLLATGRSDSTGAQNAFATNARRLGGEFENQAYQRGVGENQLNYGRGVSENESQYQREFQVHQALLNAGFTQDNELYNRLFQLMIAGFTPGPQ